MRRLRKRRANISRLQIDIRLPHNKPLQWRSRRSRIHAIGLQFEEL
jgi:hypothetical protein